MSTGNGRSANQHRSSGSVVVSALAGTIPVLDDPRARFGRRRERTHAARLKIASASHDTEPQPRSSEHAGPLKSQA
jgi:hypothetical protein